MPVVVVHMKKHWTSGEVRRVKILYRSHQQAIGYICQWNQDQGVHSPWDRMPVYVEQVTETSPTGKYPYTLEDVPTVVPPPDFAAAPT